MAKGDPSGLYVPETLSNTSDLETVVAFMFRELQRIGNAFGHGLAREVEFLNVAPDKPRDGMVRGADGTNWDPGSGQGVYVYYASAWHKMG